MMIRRWLATEEETTRLTKLVIHGTDQELVKVLSSMPQERLSSVVTHVTKGGDTVLHLAAARLRTNSVRVMLEADVDVNTRDGHDHSCLRASLHHNALSSARLLVRNRADVSETTHRHSGESLLHVMIKGNRLLAVQLLVDEGAALNAATKDGETPLHYAARYGRPKMARLLATKGADVNATNTNHETPLHVALANHNLDVAKTFVKHNANLTLKDKDGMTALHSAVGTSDLDLVRLILTSNSTQVNSKEAMFGRTPLLLACATSNQKMVALLTSQGADVNLTTHYRKSVLHEAACSGKANILHTLLKHTTNPNALATNNKTPLHCAVSEGHINAVKVLLNSGVNLNMKDIDGNTALHMAAQSGKNNIISLLLQHGAQPNTTNMLQQTALHLASIGGHSETIQILIKAGCDHELIDIHGSKAQDYIDKILQKTTINTNKATGLKRRVASGNVGESRFRQLKDIQEDNINEIADQISREAQVTRNSTQAKYDMHSKNTPTVLALDEKEIEVQDKSNLIQSNLDSSNDEAEEGNEDESKTNSGNDNTRIENKNNQKQHRSRSRRRHKSGKEKLTKNANNKLGQIKTKR